MNKKWKDLLPGCRLEECKYQGGVAAKVVYRGYLILVEPGTGKNGKPAGTVRVVINAVAEEPEVRAALEEFLIHMSAGRKEIVKLNLSHHAVELLVKGGLNRKALEGTVNPAIEEVVRYLEQNRIHTGCEFCGAQEQVGAYALDGQGHYLCQSCGDKLEIALKSAQAEARGKRSDLIAGIAGGLLGGLLGMAVWFVIYQLGYISAVGGLAISVAVCKGYELLGKHMDKRGIAVCVIAILAATYLSNQLCWSYMVYQALAEEGLTFLEANQYLWDVLELSDLTGEYMGELLLGYLFTVIGGFSVLRQSYGAANGSYRYQKI